MYYIFRVTYVCMYMKYWIFSPFDVIQFLSDIKGYENRIHSIEFQFIS